jgi:hypothetical protein
LLIRLLAASLISIPALLACSSEPERPGSAVASAGTGSTSASGGSGSAGANSAISGSGNASGTGPILNIDPDAGTLDQDAAAGCSRLNIGILGKPGSNASSNFQQWLVDSGTSVQRIQTTADQPLTSATLQPFDVVILDWLTRDYTAAEASTFAAWVSAGGGVAALSGYNDNPSDDWHSNSLLEPLQVAYSGPRRDGPVMSFVMHPITAGLTSVTFVGGYAVADLGGNASTRTAIAFLPNAPDTTAGIALQMGKGRAVVWGDEWIEFDSEWSAQPQITQFWVQLFAWIAPMNKCELTPPK